MGILRGIVSSVVLAALAAPVMQVRAADYFCFLPGANGLTQYSKYTTTSQMIAKGVPFIAFDPGDLGTTQQRAKIFLKQFAALVKKDPDARCHLFGYSMGGLLSRWSANHGVFEGPHGPEAFRGRVLSITTAATPHFGTPLAKMLRRYWTTAAPGVEQLSEENVKQFNDETDEAYSPAIAGMPTYSYRTFITRKEDADEPLMLIGFQLISQERRSRNLNPLNDGIVPTENEGFGEVLGDLNISHGYFHVETGYKVPLADFLAAHYSFLTKGTKPLLF